MPLQYDDECKHLGFFVLCFDCDDNNIAIEACQIPRLCTTKEWVLKHVNYTLILN